MRIVLLTQVFPPEPEIRNGVLAPGLARLGHEVTVITGFPNYPYGKLYPGYRMKPWSRERIGDVTVLRLPLFPSHSRSSLKRAFCYLSFALSASVLGPVLSGPVDVVFAYHPPISIGFAAWVLQLTRRARFVLEIQDMWPETLKATGMANSPALLRLIDTMCHWAYRRAAAISVISPGFKQLLVSKGVPEDKVQINYNWIDQEMFRPADYNAELARVSGMDGKFNVLYAGNMGPAQALENVIEAATQLQHIPDLQFVFLGDGMDKPKLEQMARERGLENMRFLPRRPMEEMAAYHALADAMLIHLSTDPLFRITIPGKTQGSLACGRPIIACVAGDAADLVLRSGAGVVAEPGDPAALARAVMKLYETPQEERDAMGRSGRAFFLRELSWEVLIGHVEGLLSRVSRTNRPAVGQAARRS